MSNQPYQQQPGWGQQQQPNWAQQQQPGWGTPPPQPPRKPNPGKIIGLGCAGLIGLVLVIALIGALTSSSDSSKSAAPKTSAPALTDEQRVSAAAAAGIPPEPTGAKRRQLLDALAKINPDIVKYEDKAIDATRNQCSAINNGGTKLDWAASQRFTYKDVTTTEAQGSKINKTLKDLGICKV